MFCNTKTNLRHIVYAVLVGWPLLSPPAIAQEDEMMEEQMVEGQAEEMMQSQVPVEEVLVTGSRIKRPGAVSTSPILSLTAEEITALQEPEVERILRDLPITVPGDGQNVNNGTIGIASTDLRGLGDERNLILLNGRRVTPSDWRGVVDTSIIPASLLQRVDIVTGGASAVYGSDAIAGAVNFVLKDDFEGVDFRLTHAQTAVKDGDVSTASLTLGSNLSDSEGNDRGNVAFNLTWSRRDAIRLGARDLGLLGISSSSGSGLAAFNAGTPPAISTVAGCTGPNVVDITGSGSTTSIPTRVAIVGGGSVGQFLNDRSLYTGNRSGCSRFNFNPFNYYRTPQERFNAFFTGNYKVDDKLEVYATFSQSNINVAQQVAPSGTFGAAFDVPLANPFFSDQARGAIIDFANSVVTADAGKPANDRRLTAGGRGSNWYDVNSNGVVDAADYLKMQLRRRTLELGTRLEEYKSDYWSLLTGARGDLAAGWEYDVSFQYGVSNRTTIRSGYTNLSNVQTALDTTSKTTCTGTSDSTCVPIDLFGGFGTITTAMAGYAQAIALQQQAYTQTVFDVSLTGPVSFLKFPSANDSLSLSLGYEVREDEAAFTPDECLKLAPASCQGGAGGNSLPVSGAITVDEIFFEGFLPIIDGAPLADSLGLEFGFRSSDYNTVGKVQTWKVGLNWRPVSSLLVRGMYQSAIRAPNVGELFSPVTTGLSNAVGDPCSAGSPPDYVALPISPALAAICRSTGMTSGQVGTVQDIVSGQINVIAGSDPTNFPTEEDAKSLTFGAIWTFDATDSIDIGLQFDYYDIDIKDVIGEVSAQEILDGCYNAAASDASSCALINRVNGDFTSGASGVLLYTRNLQYQRSSGIEFAANVRFDFGYQGVLTVDTLVHQYLKNESQSLASTPVIDCVGVFSTSCQSPIHKTRFVTRVNWSWKDLDIGIRWRHQGSISVAPDELDNLFAGFQTIKAYNYIDFSTGYSFADDSVKVRFSAENLFDEAPPIVGNSAGDTSFNSGNTFPSHYNVVGPIYKFGVQVRL